MATNLVEGSLTQPLQSRIINSRLGDKFFCPWKGFEAVRREITRAYKHNYQLFATDFSSTDAHFQEQASAQVQEVLSGCLHESARERLIDTIHNLHNIPLVISPTQKVVGEHGLASGSNWTNFLETVFDSIFGDYVSGQTAGAIEPLYAIGDDMCWVSRRYDPKASDYFADAASEVGQVINAEKVSNQPDRVKTLQRLFQRGYSRRDGQLRGVYPTLRALNSSLYPEKFHKPSQWNSDMFCARQFMILENCVDHPLFEDFVKFVVRGQRDLIPFARKENLDLRKITRETKMLPGFNPTYNQEKRDLSLETFASIDIARTL